MKTSERNMREEYKKRVRKVRIWMNPSEAQTKEECISRYEVRNKGATKAEST